MTGFSYQLYSSRNAPSLPDTLAMLKRAGYVAVEGYGGMFADESELGGLKAELEASGLPMPTAHLDLETLERDPERVIGIARQIGIETIYCPHIEAELRPDTGAGYRDFGRRLAEAGKPYRDAGLGFGWHNHDFEFTRLADGAMPIEAMFEGGPELEWEADLAWVIRGGADPLAWIKTFAPRITAVHVKDIAPTGEKLDEDGWADVGDGTVDWAGLLRALEQTPCRRFVMEHDNPSDATRFAERSIAAARAFAPGERP